MPAAIDLVLAGEPMRALGDRALYWPARRRLLIADLHLGKGNILRAAGIAVPSGGTAHDLARLDVLLGQVNAAELWVLGDFLHGSRHPDVEHEWRQWFTRQPGLSVAVVEGNHDRALQADALGIERLPDDILDGPFRFRHLPLSREEPSEAHVLCGHLHPVVRLPGLPRRYPAFLLYASQTVLPAFSTFTGGGLANHGESGWIACADGELVAGHLARPIS